MVVPVLEWQETADGHCARSRVRHLIKGSGSAHSAFLAGRDFATEGFSGLQEAKTWCERLDAGLPRSEIEWRRVGETHWEAVRQRGHEGSRFDISFDSALVGRRGMYSVVIAQ